MKKILLPTDFSQNAYNAIEYAVQLWERTECVFYLLNTYTPVVYDNSYLIYNATQPSLNEIYRDISIQGLKKVEKRIKKNNRHSFFENLLFRPLINEIGFHVMLPFLVIPSLKKG